jgi:hypothetical protein
MVHSHLAYAVNVYGCASKTNLEKLVIKQKQAIRTLDNASFRAHTALLFKKFKILPLGKLIEYSKIKFMHSFHFKQLPPSFINTWSTNIERIPECALRNANDLYIPPHRVEFVKRLSLYSFPLAWNQAPGDKLNPRQHLYLKSLTEIMLSNI